MIFDAISSLNVAGAGSKVITYLAIIIFILVIAGVFGFIYYLMSFPNTLRYWVLSGSVTGEMAPGVQSKNRWRWSKDGTKWEYLFPMFRKKEGDPFDERYIYDNGKMAYGYQVGEDYVPVKLSLDIVDRDGKKKAIGGTLRPIPYSVRRWQYLQLKQNELEFTKLSWWEENRAYLMTIVTAAICCAMVVLVIWFTLKFVGGELGEASSIFQSAVDKMVNQGGNPR